MSFFISHRYGEDERDPPLDRFSDLLDELDEDPSDVEHDSVGVVHESEWLLSVNRSGLVSFENREDLDIEPRSMRVDLADRKQVLDMMSMLARGEINSLLELDWKPGYTA